MTSAMTDQMLDMGVRARAGAHSLRLIPAAQRSHALLLASRNLRAQTTAILAANARDMAAAEAAGLSGSMLDRLYLDEKRIGAMAEAVEAIAAMPDPVGRELARWQRPNGLDIARVSTPIGVIGIIYESRPNVTADAAALCLRSGNAALLRCGSEALQSALAIHAAFRSALSEAGLNTACVQLVPTTDRDAVGEILKGLNGAINLIIPRGGRSLVARVQAEARVPVLAHLEGLCHTFVHEAADPQKARDIVLNAKMRRTGICGATETLLIDRAIAQARLPELAEALLKSGCELRGDITACELVPAMRMATEEDWRTEYLAPILSVRVVDGVAGAIAHIAAYSSGHTEAIITEDARIAEMFLNEVDSAIVMVNASTQFADGGEFGLGAEIGISTDRLHARGPVGAEQLTTFKYMVRGTGQVRA
ncbi:MAG: glutamate-5-semialdehyde dehydrogenase [Asticcacaulis sp.]